MQTCLAPRAAEEPAQFIFSKAQIIILLRTASLNDLLQFGEKKKNQLQKTARAFVLWDGVQRASAFKTCPPERHLQTQGAHSSVILLEEMNAV